MKKLYNLCIMVCMMIWAGACTPEVDDIFDQSAAHRINATIAEYQQILRSASNGWVLNYYPSSTQEFGGYTMLVRFQEDATAQVSCDFFEADKVGTGIYGIENSSGPMLTFNTYNEVFHFFTSPTNSLGIGEKGTGMGGDSDFLILSCTNEEVILKGKKTGNKMTMHPLQEGVSWTAYLSDIKKITREAYPASYEVIVNGQVQYTVTQRYHKFILVNVDGSQENLPFHYTSEGISFHRPLSLANIKVQDFQWRKEDMSFTNGQVTIRAQKFPKDYAQYNDYLGEFLLIYEDGEKQIPVIIEESIFNESYIMKGLPFDVQLRYNAIKGKIGLEYQELSDNIIFVPWSLANEGKLAWRQGVGMEGTIQERDATNPDDTQKTTIQIIRLQDNGLWGNSLTCDSFVALTTTGSLILQLPYIAGFYREITEPIEP